MHFEFFFFFSSRRRHTRYWRDWSSDVCSSDLRMDRRRRADVGQSRHLASGLAGLHRRRASADQALPGDRKSTRLNSSHANISYAVFCLKKKKNQDMDSTYKTTICRVVTRERRA